MVESGVSGGCDGGGFRLCVSTGFWSWIRQSSPSCGSCDRR